jgi:hypothetical protein
LVKYYFLAFFFFEDLPLMAVAYFFDFAADLFFPNAMSHPSAYLGFEPIRNMVTAVVSESAIR